MSEIGRMLEEIRKIFANIEFMEKIDTYVGTKIYVTPKDAWCSPEEIAAERRKIISLAIKDIKKSYPTMNFQFFEKWPEIREIF